MSMLECRFLVDDWNKKVNVSGAFSILFKLVPKGIVSLFYSHQLFITVFDTFFSALRVIFLMFLGEISFCFEGNIKYIILYPYYLFD